ncbi:MAG: hypothetical protein QOG04_2239, partial [Actinomycetota bacterium]|nr:hypothetical protein [Actinomycetota bacterium]
MCGIAGILGYQGSDRQALERMLVEQAHRGPDSSGSWVSPGGKCVLGATRLAILDLSTASDQPYVRDELGMCLVYNGELYNYRELRHELEGGWNFRSSGDTEVILAAYARWGADCVARFNGMFAFAIWEERGQRAFLARDRLGEKPLFFTAGTTKFAFASELRGLAQAGASTDFDSELAISYLVSDEVSDLDSRRTTMLSGIKQLLPGETLSVDLSDNAVVVHPARSYWHLATDVRDYGGTLDDAAHDLRELLRDSVSLRLRSDVAVGSCLSGGLDSSSIVATIRSLEPDRPIDTFTGRFPGSDKDEGPYAQLLAARVGARYHEVEITPERFLADAPDLYAAAGLPIGGLSQFAQWCVFRLAKDHEVTVLLDGQGSDEIFGGYGSSITRAYLSEVLHADGVGRFITERRAAAKGGMSYLRGIRNLVADRTGIRTPRARTLPFLSGEGRAIASHDRGTSSSFRGTDALSLILERLTTRTMLPSLLRYGDHLSMNFSREVRLPFCDHRIAEFAYSLPIAFIMGSGDVKRVLRHAV